MTKRDGSPQPAQVRVDQQLCTGDGLCAQLAPEVFEMDVDGLAYVRGPEGGLITESGGTATVPQSCLAEVLDAARECPGECIHVTRPGAPPPVAAGG